jgi:hypothetical protein
MRNTIRWRKDLEKEFGRHWPNPAPLSPSEMCRIELGLYLLEQIAPNEPAASLWAILTGYPFLNTLSSENRHRIFNARHVLNRYKSRHAWLQALERYDEIIGSLRGYDLDGKSKKLQRREVAFCRTRFSIYEAALGNPLSFLQREVKWAEAGSYRMSDKRGQDYGVTIPEEACFAPPDKQHDLVTIRKRLPLSIPWSELVDTARWMDKVEAESGVQTNSWEHRLSRKDGDSNSGVQLEKVNGKNSLSPASTLRLNGITHYVGMVSSGKSTMMDVVAVWAARRNLHITLVVGDVIGALNRAQLFHGLGLKAVPLLGSTRRAEHVNSLHKALSGHQPEHQIVQDHTGFRWLSTACPVDGLRKDDNPDPFAVDFRPCAGLRPVQIGAGNGTGPRYCPLYSACPYHQGQRDLVEASIWIATPASLVHTRVAEQINSESIRFAELVTRHSDIVIVDEADRVQVQLDEIFSPNQVLCSAGGDGWLDSLEQQVGEQIGKQGRTSIAGDQVETWRRAHHQAQTAADAVYQRLLSNRELREWVHELYFFTDLLLFDRLAQGMAGDVEKRTAFYKELRELFDNFIDRGLRALFSDRMLDDEMLTGRSGPLVSFSNRLLMASDSRVLRHELRAWIKENSLVKFDEPQIEQMVERLEFGLLIAILANRINALLGRWKEVEDLLKLERSSSTLLYRPPLDYQALLPVTPVGNVLAFQYLHEQEGASGAATLKFLRCTGVGRWLLLHLHDLLADEGIVGPHVLLLSGTSWAGGDPSYHVQVPVSGILRAPQRETDAIAKSEFHFLPIRGESDQSIKVSGLFGERREDALRQMLKSLARPVGLGAGGASLLERERDSLEEGRRRILLVVGSYKEAEVAREFLERERPEWRELNEMVQLVPDKSSTGSDPDFDVKLPRGQVDQFALTNAWLLIAPLMAIERGHNILNDERVAAIGAAYFLVRPHPRPQDMSYAIRSLNKWAVDEAPLLPEKVGKYRTLDAAALVWRKEANRRWRELLTTDLIYSNLNKHERDLLTWNLMVSMWQIIGRLVRGGKPARVYFCDAKFDPVHSGLAAKGISLLEEMKRVLQPYFESHSAKGSDKGDKVLVQELYGPLHEALKNMQY